MMSNSYRDFNIINLPSLPYSGEEWTFYHLNGIVVMAKHEESEIIISLLDLDLDGKVLWDDMGENGDNLIAMMDDRDYLEFCPECERLGPLGWLNQGELGWCERCIDEALSTTMKRNAAGDIVPRTEDEMYDPPKRM